MFIVDDIIVGAVTIGGIGFGIREWKNGFPVSRRLYAQITGRGSALYDRALNGPPTPEKQAEALISGYAERVGKLRSSLSEIRANANQNGRKAAEHAEIARQTRENAEKFLSKGDNVDAEYAMSIAVNAEMRHDIFKKNSDDCNELADALEEELYIAEAELDEVKTDVDTVRVYSQIKEANKRVYELISNISSESGGFSVTGQLKQLVENTERDAEASSIKLDLARESSSGKDRRVRLALTNDKIRQGLDELRGRLALPEPQENESDSDTPIADAQEEGSQNAGTYDENDAVSNGEAAEAEDDNVANQTLR